MQGFSSLSGRALTGFDGSDHNPDSVWVFYAHWVYDIDKNPQKWNLKTQLKSVMASAKSD